MLSPSLRKPLSLSVRHFGPLLVIIAAIFWGITGGLGGWLMANGWDPLTIAFYRGSVGWLFVSVWLLWHPGHSGLNNPWLWLWSVVAGLGIAGNFTFYFISIAQGSVAVAATLMYCAPVFVLLISFALKLETPTFAKWSAMAVVSFGIVLLTQVYQSGASHVSFFGVIAGLLAGLAYAGFIFGLKYAAPHGSPQAILMIAFSVLVILLAGLVDGHEVMAAIQSQHVLWFAGIGVLGAGLSFILYVIGLHHTAPAVAAIIAMVEPVTASILGVWLLNQGLEPVQLLGMGLILATVTALSRASA
ncbi:hypothetical protein AVO41_06330 [Thiomicrospira sp. WB1]|nr:hypothetical protein AVO41_06330 [Thiomicrospira sp. WB1]